MKKKGWNNLFHNDDEIAVTEQIKERPGICSNCGHGSFKLKIIKRHLLRGCKKCTEVIDPNTMKVLRKGKEQ